MPLPLVLPFQFALAALGEAGVGYDSTAVNPRTGQYVDAALGSIAADAQASYQGTRVRLLLRDRGEAIYEDTGGQDVTDSDLFNITRFALIWRPSEVVEWFTAADYALGAPTFFFSRAGRPDVSFDRTELAFPRQMIAAYGLHQQLLFHLGDRNTLSAEAALDGQYPLTRQPPGVTMFLPYTAARLVHLFDEDNSGHVGARVEYLDLELFRPVWVSQAFVGFSHRFRNDCETLLEGGLTLVEENQGADTWDSQPYGRARIYKRFERARIMAGATYTHTFGVVSATIGTGTVDAVTASALWMPERFPLVAFADASFQYGQTYQPLVATPQSGLFGTAIAGVRWRFAASFALFARYVFQYEHDSFSVATAQPDFVRHVMMIGVQAVIGTTEIARNALIPMEEINAMERAEGIGADPAAAPVHTAPADGLNNDGVPASTRLPGDPPADEIDRERREAEHPGDGAPAQPGQAPGDVEPADPNDPFQHTPEEAP